MFKHIATTLCLLLVTLVFSTATILPGLAVSDIPEGAIKIPPLVPEQSVSTYVPSEACPGSGIAVNIIYPEIPRYPDGAPVAVISPGGESQSGLSFTMHSAQQGFIEVRLAFPGGGEKGFLSGGISDYRGEYSLQALKDVILFAAGKLADANGKKISELVPVKVSGSNIGLVGWSTGGNPALVTLGTYPTELKPVVSWLSLYECPTGDLFTPPNLGGNKDLLLNPHYRQGTCATGDCKVDWRNLKWEPGTFRNPGEHKKMGEPEVAGVLYFDDNNNNKWDESIEYALSYVLDTGLEKQIYPPEPLAALNRLKRFDVWRVPKPTEEEIEKKNAEQKKAQKEKESFKNQLKTTFQVPNIPLIYTKKPPPKKPEEKKEAKHFIDWPDELATEREAESYYAVRDGSKFIGKICSSYPDLLVEVIATAVDHLQRQPDHPHIALQYNAFLANKVHWIRINPEALYPATLAAMNPGNFTNNRPNATIDPSSITNYLEPEGFTRDYVVMEGSLCELADRRRSKNLTSPLVAPLTLYHNRLNPPPAPKPKADE